MSKRVLGVVAAALALWIKSASAAPLPFFYFTGPTTVPALVGVGTFTYRLWVDPSGINTPGWGEPINGACIGIFLFTLKSVHPTVPLR
jgi:hypothetical protein